VHENQLCIRQLLWLSLTFDHRAIDGAPAAEFLNDVVQLIQKPDLLWLW
jgi:pyruvate dehydrogenase E2 component (dihydrolipoamide acetyltransferase)